MAFSRRDFLKKTCCTAAAGFAAASFNRFGLVNALAQSAQDYKALVCVFLFGGNDSNNMVIPLSSSGYASYQQTRSVLALPQAGLLPINPSSAGSPFGFHPRFTGLQSLFNQQHLAVLANVGTLVRPTTRAQFQQGQAALPRNLFSHEDQQAQMQTAALDGSGQTGWAGRTADKIQSIYGGTFPIIISLAGTNIFCEGLSARAIQSSGDPTKLLSGFSSSAESQGRMSTLQSLLTFDTGVSLIQQASSITGNALQDSNALACPGGGAGFGNRIPRQQRSGKPTQTGSPDYLGALGTGTATADFLRLDRWFRHSQRSTECAQQSLHPAQPGDECVLPGDGGDWRGLAGHVLHFVGLQPDLCPGQHLRNRPCLGWPSPDHGRSSQGRRFLWHLPHPGSRGSGRRHQRRTLDSDDL